jgi:hypothetical protein
LFSLNFSNERGKNSKVNLRFVSGIRRRARCFRMSGASAAESRAAPGAFWRPSSFYPLPGKGGSAENGMAAGGHAHDAAAHLSVN